MPKHPSHHTNPRRDYRLAPSAARGEVAVQVVVGETDLWLVAGRDLSREAGEIVRRLRGQLSSYLLLHPEFGESLMPLAARSGAPEIARRMARAAEPFGVGPMAAVAGTVAQLVGEELDASDLLVENGGDCFLKSTRERTIGLLAKPVEGVKLGLKLAVEDFPLGVCASSGRIGHSLSFGQGDLVVVRSRSASVADAAATALANRLGTGQDIQNVADTAQAWQRYGVDGVFAQGGGQLALWGALELAALG